MSRIVLVDDNLTTLKRWEAQLIPLGHEVISFTGAEEALQLLKIHHVDLVVLDLAMPVHTGYDLMQQLRSDSIQVPILVVSGKNKNEDIEKAISMGAADYILKPFDDDIFVAKVDMVIKSHQGNEVHHHFAEAQPTDPATLILHLSNVTVSELGFSFRCPTQVPLGIKLNLNIPFLEKLNLEKSSLKITSVTEDPQGPDFKYKVFVSFVGLSPAQLQNVRLWVRENQIKNKKVA